MCVQNCSYFNGNLLPGVFPGPQVNVSFAADIPEARKGPDSFNKHFSVLYTNKLQGSKFNKRVRRVAIRHRNRTPVCLGDRKRCEAMRCDTFCSSQYTQLVATRFNATRCVYCEPAFRVHVNAQDRTGGNH